MEVQSFINNEPALKDKNNRPEYKKSMGIAGKLSGDDLCVGVNQRTLKSNECSESLSQI